MIEHKVFIDRARYLQKPVPSAEEIDSALAQYDEAAMTQGWQDRIAVQVWDGVSNINSATPEYIIESNPWLDKVYLLLIDGKITYMQTHQPYVEGYVPITSATVDSISQNHASNVASDLAINEIVNRVMSDLGLVD